MDLLDAPLATTEFLVVDTEMRPSLIDALTRMGAGGRALFS